MIAYYVKGLGKQRIKIKANVQPFLNARKVLKINM
jgi:hypothetical protein